MLKKLDKKTVQGYKKILTTIKENISSEIKQIANDASAGHKDSTREGSSGHALHMADVATDMYDREFSLGLASNNRELLNKVDQALVKIEEGTFGLCSECQKPIASARLKALPYVQTCLKCQEKLEAR